MAEFKNFGFYTVNADYLQFLNQKDTKVVRRTYCNFSVCEAALEEWLQNEQIRAE